MFESHIQAVQSLFSCWNGKVSLVVVAAVATEALVVVAEIAHRFEIPPPHVGGAFATAVGVVLALQMRRK